MTSRSDTHHSENERRKRPLLQELLQENPLLHQHIPRKDWFLFLQQILKAIKISDNREIFQFLNARLPRLIERQVPAEALAEGMSRLRSLVFHHIISDRNIPSQNKELLITQLLTLFDGIFRLLREKYASQSPAQQPEPQFLRVQQLNQLENMAFYAEGERFGSSGYLNTAFLKWTAADAEQLGVKLAQKLLLQGGDEILAEVRLAQVQQ